MKKFFRNILRTIAQNKISYIGAVLIIAMGALIYTGMTDFNLIFDEKSTEYFEKTAFADVFVEVASMSKQKVGILEDIEGVDSCFGRLEGNMRLLRDGETKIITIHAMAYSPNDNMNKLLLEPEPDNMSDTDIYISKKMCDIYNIQNGDVITVIANNKTKKLTCRGIAYSSERMTSTADESATSPDSSVFDIAAMSTEGLEKLLGVKGEITNIGIRLADGAAYSDVRYSIEQTSTTKKQSLKTKSGFLMRVLLPKTIWTQPKMNMIPRRTAIPRLCKNITMQLKERRQAAAKIMNITNQYRRILIFS